MQRIISLYFQRDSFRFNFMLIKIQYITYLIYAEFTYMQQNIGYYDEYLDE